MLSNLLIDDFSPEAREAGERLFRARAVQITSYSRDGGEDFVEASVSGGGLVQMVISGDRSHLYVDSYSGCACDVDFCQHVWGTIRALETRYSLPAAREATLTYFEPAENAFEETRAAKSGGKPGARGALQMLDAMLGARRGGADRTRARVPVWQEMFSQIQGNPHARAYSLPSQEDTSLLEPWYIFEQGMAESQGGFPLTLGVQRQRANGAPAKLVKLALRPQDIARLASDLDRHICLMLLGTAAPQNTYDYFGYSHGSGHSQWQLRGGTLASVLQLIGQTGRLMRREYRDQEPIPIRWEPEPYDFVLALEPEPGKRDVVLRGWLRRRGGGSGQGDVTPPGQASIPVQEIYCLYNSQLFLAGGCMGVVNADDCGEWLSVLMQKQRVVIRERDREAFLRQLTKTNRCPAIEFPPSWNVTISDTIVPQPELLLRSGSGRGRVDATLRFKYGSVTVDAPAPGGFVFESATHQIRRQRPIEAECGQKLHALGFRQDYYGQLKLHPKKLAAVLSTLVEEKWSVLLDNKSFRPSTGISVEVGTGIDWFELNGKVDFNGQSIGLPSVLAAARRGERFVRLDDGSFGMVPDEWLSRHKALFELGNVEAGQIRYSKAQLGLIDALLMELPEARFDEQIAAARRKLANFGGIGSGAAPPGFGGELRPYQQHGLAWMDFLREFGWGGCLADDMGLGKTVQMLAQLLHHQRRGGGVSLAVLPKSVVFNWAREAARFAPELRVLDYTGADRHAQAEQIADADLVLTTYGTLKRDIRTLREINFAYVILDEAQAIKNPQSQNAKAVRLLKAESRLALTGTPVENCIGDLWSIFDFLNPGMLGTMKGFKQAFRSDRESDHFRLLQRMLRPFILRRSKQQVAPELPARSEQLVECELSGEQATTYGELRDHYRAALLGRLDREGMAKSKVYVLEALLRLRQAACHPGLLDSERRSEQAAKLETLIPMLQEIISEGHKALVFSQFTSMLSIVRERLETEGIAYEYLDGRTRDRKMRVDRFQSDSACPIFLISLKAGGVGLNLTAAEYVFILDPWWNPAVEAQAIDRTHRIGQDKHVMAYRLIARNTVESKILELQQRKRGLAEAIITQANSMLQDLTREDLEMLLS